MSNLDGKIVAANAFERLAGKRRSTSQEEAQMAPAQPTSRITTLIQSGRDAIASGIRLVTGRKDQVAEAGSNGSEQHQDRDDSLLRYLRSQFEIIFNCVLQQIIAEGSDPVKVCSFADEAELRESFMADFVAYYAADHLGQIDEIEAHTLDLHEMKERMRSLLNVLISTRGNVKDALRAAGIHNDAT